MAAGTQLTPAIDKATKTTSHHTATPSTYSASIFAGLSLLEIVFSKPRLISRATSSGSLSNAMSDVPEIAAAALAASEAGGALARLRLQRRHAEAALVREGFAELEVPLLVGRAPIGPHAELRELRDHLGQRLGFGERLAFGHQPVGEPPLESLARADLAASQDHVERTAVTDQARQTNGAAVDQRDAPAPAEHAEPGPLGRHPQVAPQRELEPARHGITFNGGDHRFGEDMARRPHPPRRLPMKDRWGRARPRK